MSFTNYAPNPSGEVDLAGWSTGFATNTLTRDTARARVGAASVLASWDGTDGAALLNVPGLTIGSTYTARMSVYVPAGSPPVTATVYFLTSGQTSTLVDQWETLEVTFTPDGTTESIGIGTGGTPAPAGTRAWVDALLVVEGDHVPTFLPDYFDGDTPDSSEWVYSWTGTPHNSPCLAEPATVPAYPVTAVAPYVAPVPIADTAQAHRVEVDVVDDEARAFPLDLLDARLSFDGTRAPRVTLDVRAAVPAEPTLAVSDPRLLRRVRVHAGYGSDVRLIADLGLRERSVDRPADTFTATAASDEAVVMDDGEHFDRTVVTNSSIPNAIKRQVQGATGPVAWVVDSSDATVTNVDITGTSRWDIVDDLADRLGLDVYDDGLRVWHIVPRVTTTAATPDHVMQVGPDSTVTSSTATITRGQTGFYNRVQLFYEWTDSADVDHRVQSMREVTSGPFASVIGSRVTYSETRNVPTSQAAADAAAKSLLDRFVTRGRAYQVTGVAAYWLRPGHTVRLGLPTGPVEDHLVERVDFDLIAGLMTVSLRIPDDLTYTTGGPA